MEKAAGWRTDPEHHDRERYWDGIAWTDEVRPAEQGARSGTSARTRARNCSVPCRRPPPTSTWSRTALSTLFERTEDRGQPRDRPRPQPRTPARRDPLRSQVPVPHQPLTTKTILDFFEDGEEEEEAEADDDVGFAEPAVADRRAIIGEYEDDIGGLRNPTPSWQPRSRTSLGGGRRRVRRRRAKGTAAVSERRSGVPDRRASAPHRSNVAGSWTTSMPVK